MTIAGRVSRCRLLNKLVFFPFDYIFMWMFRVIVYGFLPVEANRYVLVFMAVLCGYFIYTSSLVAVGIFLAYMLICLFYFIFNERRYVLSFGIAGFLFSDKWEHSNLFLLYILILTLMLVRVVV